MTTDISIRTHKLKIGLDLHNLSTRGDRVIRTGIQQVVRHLLEAQYVGRNLPEFEHFEIVPFPGLPTKARNSKFADLSILHGNNSGLVLKETAKELGASHRDLWNSESWDYLLTKEFDQRDFYKKAQDLDWIIFTGLSDFRFMVEEIKRTNPKIKTALLIYDLIPVLIPETADAGMRNWFSTCYINSISNYADLIFTDSRHTALDCCRFFQGVLSESTPIISAPINSEIPTIRNTDLLQANETLMKHNVTEGRYFICIGTIEPRKNIGLAIKGFLRFKNLFKDETSDYKLLIIGSKGWNNFQAEMKELIGDHYSSIVLPGYMDQREMELLIFHSLGLLMPSRYEGYGMPLQLAENFEVATISCINSSLPESSNLNSYYCKTDSHDEVALAMYQIKLKYAANKGKKSINLDARAQEIKEAWVSYLKWWCQSLLDYTNELKI